MSNKESYHHPPKWASLFLRWLCPEEDLEMLQGDVEELYRERVQRLGPFNAKCFLFFNLLGLLKPFISRKKRFRRINTIDMFRNYWKISLRNFSRQKLYSSINVSGLAIGLACFILIFIYIEDELSFDKFHSKSERVYRVDEKFESEGVGEHSASQPFPVGPTLVNDFPRQIESAVRFFNFQSPTLALANRKLDRQFNESRIFFADSTLFDVFDFEVMAGDKNTALDEPNAILITRSMVKKYFGDDDPMGQILEFQGEHNYRVTGVLEDSPLNAHFQFDFIISFSSLRPFFRGTIPSGWYWNPCWTYVVLEENTDPTSLISQFEPFVEKYFPEFVREDITLGLQPLEDIHLNSKLDYEIQANGSYNNIYIFSGVALFVLLIAGINFVNLSTARATKRAKEVGVRKSLGSEKIQLITQFIFESVMYSVFAVIVALLIVILVLPQFNGLTEKAIALSSLFTPIRILLLTSLALFIGCFAGFYPAFVLSSYKTIAVLKNNHVKTKGFNFRRILVTLQFTISIMLIIGTIMAVIQLQFLQDDDLGFEKEHILMIPVIRSPMGEHYKSFKDVALTNPNILSMTAVEEITGAKFQVGNYRFGESDKSKPYPRFQVRHDFLKTYDIPLIAGRTYDENIFTDDSLALVVNETMARNLGFDNPADAVGHRYRSRYIGKIVGVVKDYNFTSKHHPIAPLVLDLNMNPRAFNLFIKYVSVRVNGENVQQALVHLKSSWEQFIPNRPFDYFFLDDRLDDSYRAEQKLSKVTIIFSILAILVACLGLFGLATFSVEQRTKEIGVRKVLGINTGQILVLLSKEFLILILLSFIIATPLTYYALSVWLNQFAFRVDIMIWPFLVAGALTATVAMATVGYHAWRASRFNPINSLRYE